MTTASQFCGLSTTVRVTGTSFQPQYGRSLAALEDQLDAGTSWLDHAARLAWQTRHRARDQASRYCGRPGSTVRAARRDAHVRTQIAF